MHNIDLKNVRGVLIDLDETLYAYTPASKIALVASHAAFCQYGAIDLEQFTSLYASARERVTKRLWPQGTCRSRLFAFQILCEEANLSTPYKKADLLDKIYWDAFIQEMKPSPIAVTFLDACAAQQIPVCVVTDMLTHIQVRKLERLRVMDRVAHMVTSEEVGCEKPDARMFEAGLRKLGVSASEAIMIGDDQAKDIDGAQACGIRAYLYSAGRDM